MIYISINGKIASITDDDVSFYEEHEIKNEIFPTKMACVAANMCKKQHIESFEYVHNGMVYDTFKRCLVCDQFFSENDLWHGVCRSCITESKIDDEYYTELDEYEGY